MIIRAVLSDLALLFVLLQLMGPALTNLPVRDNFEAPTKVKQLL